MARLIGPDEGSRLVYTCTATGVLTGAPGQTATYYQDQAVSALADIITLAGAPIPNSQMIVDAYSRLPLFQFPDGVDVVWVVVSGGPPTPVYARTDDRLDTKAEDTTVAHLAGAETLTGIKTFTAAPMVPAGAFPQSAVASLTGDLAGKAPTGHTHAASAPLAHATSHAMAGSDPLTPVAIGAATTAHAHTGTYTTPTDLTAAVTAHEAGADPHPTYLTTAEGDGRYYTETEVDAALTGKAPVTHGHTEADITNLVVDLAAKAADSVVVKLTGDQALTGVKTFVSAPLVPVPVVSGNPVRNDDTRFRAPISFRSIGAIGDGVTDDAPAIQAAVNAAAFGTTFYMPGVYLLRAGIKWKSGISLIGDGPGKSILKTYNAGPFASGFSAIYNYTDGSTVSTLDDCTFADFEIDGSGVTTSSYDVGAKGINILYMRRARFLNLYVHNTWASGIGCDQLIDSAIINCVCANCGVGNNGTQIGGAGIGIGTGAFASMPLAIIGCVTKSNATHGIFLEHQNPAWSPRSYGVRILGCHTEGNNYGISDWGSDGLIVAGCTFSNNTIYGFGSTGEGVAHFVGTNGIITSSTFTGHPADAIRLGDGMTRYTVRGCTIKLGSGSAIVIGNVYASAATASQELAVTDNEIVANGAAGIRVNAPLNWSSITGNRIRNNGLTTGNTSDLRSGISINNTLDRPTITGNTCWDNQGTKTQTYGLYLTAAGVTTNGVIRDNYLLDNLTGPVFTVTAGTIGVGSTPVRKINSGTLIPSATANTAGSVVVLSPTAGRLWFTHIYGMVATFSGTFGAETATVNVTVTFNDNTTASSTLTSTSVSTKVAGSDFLRNTTKDARYATQVSVSLQSTIASSAVTASFDVLAIQN